MALLEHRRHKHDIVAKTTCRVYVLDSAALARVTSRHPEVMRRIPRSLGCPAGGHAFSAKPQSPPA